MTTKKDLHFLVLREEVVPALKGEHWTPGRVYCDGVMFCFSCEDQDRFLEKGGVKVKTRTAIPRGTYKLTVSMSNRFRKELPEVLNVPQFSGIRIHGGNRAEDSEGCLLFGRVRTSSGVSKCAETVQKVIAMIKQATVNGQQTILEIK